MLLDRAEQLQRLQTTTQWDVLIIGGGATGLGAAVEAATRGLKVALVEQHDFGKGTSSRSTKLVHGGVRYLAQGNIRLVIDALHERGYLLKNAPHLTAVQPFIVPAYSLWQKMYYYTGLKMYDWLAGRLGLGTTRLLSRADTLQALPHLQGKHLKGGILYYDGQFDDTRLLVELAKTAVQHHACIVNYCQVTDFIKTNERISGVQLKDTRTGQTFRVSAKIVINATGVFAERLLRKDTPRPPIRIAPSQGIHFVLDSKAWASATALMIPKTSDGRVLFVVPWHAHLIVGTTDTPVKKISDDPLPLIEEVNYLLAHWNKYCHSHLTPDDVKSVYVGLRPLVKRPGIKNTKLLPRDHTILLSKSGLLTITGGKWTTYRKMAEQVIDKAIGAGALAASPSRTRELPLYQSQLPLQGIALHPALPYTEQTYEWVIANEMACTIEDVLARRTRSLFLDARASSSIAPLVGAMLQKKYGWSAAQLQKEIHTFQDIAQKYILTT